MAAHLQDLLITVKVVALGKVFFSEKLGLFLGKVLRLFVNTLAVNDKDHKLNRDNLPQPIQMQLSPKQKNVFINFLSHF